MRPSWFRILTNTTSISSINNSTYTRICCWLSIIGSNSVTSSTTRTSTRSTTLTNSTSPTTNCSQICWRRIGRSGLIKIGIRTLRSIEDSGSWRWTSIPNFNYPITLINCIRSVGVNNSSSSTTTTISTSTCSTTSN